MSRWESLLAQASPVEVEAARIAFDLKALIQRASASGFPTGGLQAALHQLEMADVGLWRHRRGHKP